MRCKKLAFLLFAVPVICHGFEGFPQFEWPFEIPPQDQSRVVSDSDCPSIEGLFLSKGEVFSARCDAGQCEPPMLEPGVTYDLSRLFPSQSPKQRRAEVNSRVQPTSGVLTTIDDNVGEVQQPTASEFMVRVLSPKRIYMSVSKFQSSLGDFTCSDGLL